MIHLYHYWLSLLTTLLFVCLPFNYGHPQSSEPKSSRSTKSPVALVIGNAAYPTAPLRNPVKDGRAIAGVLTELGFQVNLAIDVTYIEMEKAIDRFIASLEPGSTALFYYAGHGIQIDGENYLIPINFVLKDEADAKYSAYSVSRVTERLERSGARLKVIILDACRDNPFLSTRSTSRGLAIMTSGQGTFIAFATGPGQTASDGPKDSNGLFTGHLVKVLKEQGLNLDQVFSKVREKVALDSNRKQIPWTASNVIGEFYFNPPKLTGSASEPAKDQVIQIPELNLSVTQKGGIYYCSNGLPVCPKPLSLQFDGRGGCCALGEEIRKRYNITQGPGPNAEEIISGLIGVWKGKLTYVMPERAAATDITLVITRASGSEVFGGTIREGTGDSADLYKIISNGKRFAFGSNGDYYSGTLEGDLMKGNIQHGGKDAAFATIALNRIEKRN